MVEKTKNTQQLVVEIDRLEARVADLQQQLSECGMIDGEPALPDDKQQLFRRIVDALPQLIWVAGEDKQFTYFNRQWLAYTGRTIHEQLSDGWSQAVHPDDVQRCLNTYNTSFDARQRFDIEYRLRGADGEYRWFLDSGVPWFDEHDRFAGYVGAGVDITDRKAAAEAVRVNEGHLRALMESASGFVVYRLEEDPNDNLLMRVVFVSPSITEIMGVADPLDFATWFDDIHRDDRARVTEAHMESARTGVMFNQEMRIIHPHSKECRWIRAISNPVKDIQTGRIYYNGVIIDITRQKRAEESLWQSERRNRALLDAIPDFMFRIREDGTFVDYHANQVDELALPPERFLNRSVHECFSHEFAEKMMGNVRTALATGETQTVEYQLPKPHGSNQIIDYECRIVVCDQEEVMAIVRDISDRKWTERQLRQSEEQFSTLLESLNDVVWSATAEGKMLYLNDAVERLYGIAAGQFFANPNLWHEVVHPDDRNDVAVSNEKLFARGHCSLEYRIVRPDGEVRWISDRKSVVFDSDGRVIRIGGIVTDISERVRSDEQLIKSQASLEAAQARAKLGSWEFFPQDGSGTWSKEMFHLFGLEPAQPPPSFDEFLGLIHPDDRDLITLHQQRALEGRNPSSIDFRTSPARGPVRYLNASVQSVRESGVNSVRLVGTVLDITERKQAEDALRHNEEHYRAILENAFEGIGVIDCEARIQYVSPSAQRILGYEPDELVGRSVFELVLPEDEHRAADALVQVLQQPGTTLEVEVGLRHGDGSVRHIEARAVNLLDNPRVEGIVLNFRDVTEKKQTEARLIVSEARFRTLVECSYDLICLFSPDGELLYASPSIERTLGYKPQDLIGKKGPVIVHPDDVPSAQERFRESLEHPGTPIQFKHRVRHADGTYRTVEMTGVNLLHEPGINALLSVFRDITERETAETALRESEQRFRTLVENAAEAIVVFDVEQRTFVDCNKNALQLFNVERDALLKMGLLDLSPPRQPSGDASISLAEAAIERALAGESPSFEWMHCNTEGKEFPCEVRLVRLRDRRRRLVRGSITDITERKRAEQKLRDSERSLAMAQAIANIGSWDWDLRTGVAMWSRQMHKIHGITGERRGFSYEEYLQFVHPDDRPTIESTLQRVMTTGEMTPIEYRILLSDGQIRWVFGDAQLICDENDAPVRMIGIVQDITERKAAEQKLQESERSLEKAQSIARVGSWENDLATGELSASTELYRIIGISPDSLEHQVPYFLDHFVHPDDRPLIESAMHKAISSGAPKPIEFRLRRPPNDEVRYVRAEAEFVNSDEGSSPKMIGTLQDVTEQKLVELALRESEEKFRALSERSPAFVCILQDRHFKYCNPATLAATGYTLDEITEMEYLDIAHPDDRELVRERHLLRQQDESTPIRYEARYLTKSGDVRWVDISTELIDYEGQSAILAIGVDITQRKLAEEQVREREMQLAHVSRLSTMGEMVAGIAHEVNQPLYSILNFAKAANNALATPERISFAVIREWNEEVRKAATRAGRIIKRLRKFVSLGSQRSSIDLTEVLHESIELIAFQTKRFRAVLNVDVPQSALFVHADRVQIQQVMINLLINAFEAMESNDASNRQVTIATEQKGQFVEVAVADSGPGLPDEYNTKVFDPFVTTKTNGMGMGLAISSTIITSHRGQLWASANDKGGATFCFTLPLNERVNDDEP